MTRAVILGAGLMGRLLALSLAREGWRIELHDAAGPEADGAAARVAAAMLAPLAESVITEPPVVQMGQYALERWPQLLATLPQKVFFQQAGTVILWHRQDAGEARRFRERLSHNQAALPSLAAPETLDRSRLHTLEPGLAERFDQALYLPDEGQLDNRQLLSALLLGLQAAGVSLHWGSTRSMDEFPAVSDGGPDWVFDCRGLGARKQWQDLRGVRGEVLRLHAPEVALSRPTRLIHPRYPIYIAPKPDGVFVVGATEIESEDLSPVSLRSTMELLSAAYTVHPGFGEARILETATQARPTLGDNLPALRVLGPQRLQINGLYRHGFLISPAVLDAALEWILQGRSTLASTWPLRIETASHTPS
jgi:glycine oxidase